MSVLMQRYGACLLLMALALDHGYPATFTIAREGQATATIVLSRKPSPSAMFASWELREHVRRMTGADLPLVNDADEDPDGDNLTNLEEYLLGSDPLAEEIEEPPYYLWIGVPSVALILVGIGVFLLKRE